MKGDLLNSLRRPLEASSATASTALNSATCFEPYERGESYSHNAHFWDNGYRFGLPFDAVFDTSGTA
jgi:hypothetical protein